MRKFISLITAAALFAPAMLAAQEVASTDPVISPEAQMELPPAVVLDRFLAKIRVVDRTLDVGKTYTVRPLEIINYDDKLRIQAASCVHNNDSLNGGDAAYLSVIGEKGEPIFNGWLFSKFLSASAVEHPKFSVFLEGCRPL